MGVYRSLILVESDTPPSITLGQDAFGGVVKEMKLIEDVLLSASQLAEKYNTSVQTVRRKLADFNQGTSGKYLYNASIADGILSQKTKRGSGGARRKN